MPQKPNMSATAIITENNLNFFIFPSLSLLSVSILAQ
jgi:hypothetical protein